MKTGILGLLFAQRGIATGIVLMLIGGGVLGFFLLQSKSVESSPSTGLVGEWKFEDSPGINATDTSGNGNNGTLYVGQGDDPNSKWVDGIVGQALEFDGVNDYIQVPYDPNGRGA